MKRAIRTIGENVTIYDDGITAVVGSVCVLELVSQQKAVAARHWWAS